jgi:hypothetical protein
MKATATTLALASFFSVHGASAQNRSAALDKAYYLARQAILEQQVELARQAMKRWNGLK